MNTSLLIENCLDMDDSIEVGESIIFAEFEAPGVVLDPPRGLRGLVVHPWEPTAVESAGVVHVAVWLPAQISHTAYLDQIREAGAARVALRRCGGSNAVYVADVEHLGSDAQIWLIHSRAAQLDGEWTPAIFLKCPISRLVVAGPFAESIASALRHAQQHIHPECRLPVEQAC